MTLDTVISGLGVAGAAMIIVAYFANQQGWMATSGWLYSSVNLLGALLILLSLSVAWNLAAAVMELFWALISLYGIVRWLRARGSRAI